MAARALLVIGICLCLAGKSCQDVARLGCAKDKYNDREMTTIIDAGSLTSQEYCVQHCNSTGHKYAALQNGQFCQCGDSYGRHGMASDADCATKCKGQVHETCGGTFRNEIFDSSIGSTDKKLRLRNCRQSSNFGHSRCTGAIDGNTNQRWSETAQSTTSYEDKPWWEAQAEQRTRFDQVLIYNRQDCCADRLNNFEIKVDGHVCARYQSSTTFSIKVFACNKVGRVIRIESQKNNHLTLAEVVVYGERVEQAATPKLPLSQCQQSSGTYKCTLAIDGNTNQAWSGGSQAATNEEDRPWWQAKTSSPTMIKQVRIFNRQDCCPERLNNFVIKVDGHVCAEYNSPATFSVWTFDCNRRGSIVRIESRKKTVLTLAEVQVF